MKRIVSFMILALFAVFILGCTHTAYKEEPLSYVSGVQYMLTDISDGNMDKAMGRIYTEKAESQINENLLLCAELLNGREIMRCDCYDYERSGNRSDISTIYTETTYYRIYLTEDYSSDPDFYVKATGILDANGDGIVSFEIYSEIP